jgi:hypothetical protein
MLGQFDHLEYEHVPTGVDTLSRIGLQLNVKRFRSGNEDSVMDEVDG